MGPIAASVVRPVATAEDVLSLARYAWRLAAGWGCDARERTRLAAAALNAASQAKDGVRFALQAAPEPGLLVSAVPDSPHARHRFPVPEGACLTGPGENGGELQAFSADLLQVLGAAAETAEALQSARRLSQSLETELEETNRGVLALYAELDDRALKLRRADELKSRFLSYASHELRTPLNGIVGLVRLLRESSNEHDPEERKQLAFIQQAAEEMREMVNDLLDLAKVEAGKVTVQPTEFGLEFVFGALRGMFRPLLQTDDVVLRFEDTSAVPSIYSDEAKVSQILRNFISNALKFTEHGEVRVWATAHDGLVRIDVQDTGIGIAPENLGRIFEEYAQIEHPLQRRVRGTGLGLPLCKRIAELLGGRVEVVSELGKGSTFTLVLPQMYSTGMALSGETTRSDPARRQHPRLLIIDDAEIDRYLLKQLVKAGGEFTILEAEDGQSGLEAAIRQKPDLIFLDLSLPKVDGFRVLSELRDNETTRQVPVVIVTARSLSDAERAQLEPNTTAIFQKESLSEARKLHIDLGPPAAVQTVS